MHGGAYTLLDCSDGSFDLADVGVSGCGVEGDGRQVISKALELRISVHITNNKPTLGVHVDDSWEMLHDGSACAVRDQDRASEADAPVNGV